MTTDPNLTAVRDTLGKLCREAKAAFPDRDHSVVDRILATLDTIPGDLIPDFVSLDGTTGGAVTQMMREDALALAERNRPKIADACALIRALVMFIDALRVREIEMIANRVRRMLDGRRLYDA